MSRILLISPKFDTEFSRAYELSGLKIQADAPRSLIVPLNLATIAALTPEAHDVDIWDESVRGEIDNHTDLGREYDLIGVTGYIAHIPRAVELAGLFRQRGIPTAIGGPGVSGAPHLFRDAFDVLFLGEAEYTWPQFLRDWEKGAHRSEYRQVERPDLSDCPTPRWDSIADDIPLYRLGGVQTTRGCPYDCEFCDVIHLFGRRPRHRPIESVIEEVVTLQRLGAERIFLCDDNFVSNRKYARQLLRELIPVNNSFDPPLSYSTQLTIDLAQDEELMELMADCNFTQVLIGIETTRPASLQEVHKVQNLRRDMVEDCKKIQSYGVAVRAALIVGFDADDAEVFEEQMRFLEDSNIASANVNTLKAYPGTPLWVRLQLEDRVLDVGDMYHDAPKVVCNIIPKQMTRVELLEGYRRLLQQTRAWDSFQKRIKAFVSSVTRQPNLPPPSSAVRQKRMQRLSRAREAMAKLPEDARTAIMDVVAHTLQTAPYMLEKVAAMTMQQLMDAILLPYQSELIQRQIDQTLAGKLKLDPDPSAGMIPEEFHAAAGDIIPVLYDRLNAEIEHKATIPEVITAVLKDFLIRWGSGFTRLEDYHQAYLSELCDRHVERWNSKEAPGAGGGDGQGPVLTVERAGSARFVREVLVSVEQALRGEVKAKRESESERITGARPG
ncbi:MAG: B12-binding domain-containing radical SAM protein [Phycisphaerales bacterium]|nr:MAG: B12-binding domain-containing radical SAM protein [Phycisphaerales bacterium]